MYVGAIFSASATTTTWDFEAGILRGWTALGTGIIYKYLNLFIGIRICIELYSLMYVNVYSQVCIYIYIYTYLYMCMYVYTYIYEL
jgi:hypothetical protein